MRVRDYKNIIKERNKSIIIKMKRDMYIRKLCIVNNKYNIIRNFCQELSVVSNRT